MTRLPARDAFTSSGFFLLRTPLLPLAALLRFASLDKGGERVAALRAWAERPEVAEALWIASPELVQSLPTLWERPEGPKAPRLEQALYRYLARMTARSTPFGAFAGCSMGHLGEATRLDLPPRAAYHLHTRLDMEVLCGLAAKVAEDPALRPKLRFRTNGSLHAVASRHHHVHLSHPDGLQVVQLLATEATPALDATLARAREGATAEALALALMAEDPDILREEADAFLAHLIDSQLLLSELMPPVTGQEPITYLAEQLEKAEVPQIAEGLRAVAEALRTLDEGSLGSGRDYAPLATLVRSLGVPFKPGRLVQVDMVKPAADLSLDADLSDRILDAIEALHAIRQDTGPSPLRAFQEAFLARYQDREVPLLEALDDEAGLGFEQEDNPTTEPLIAGIDFRPVEDAPQATDRPLPPPLQQRLDELRAAKGLVLDLDADLVAQLRREHPPSLPDTFSVMGSAFQMPGGATGFALQSAFGPSGVNLLTRFCRDAELTEAVQAHLRAEEALAPDKCFAEILHLPEGRVGNVICRPDLRRPEIPLMTTPGVPAERQIPLSDLSLSVREDRLVLRSRRLGVEVLPRLTCAHNFANARSWKLYKFLGLLQHQGALAELFFDWGAAREEAFLPRVTVGPVVVALARWRIKGDIALDLGQGRLSVAQWREAHRVPRLAFIAEGDHQLLIDFDNPLAVDTFLDQVRKQTETVLMELFPGPEGLVAQGPEGRFVHEMVLPYVRRRPREAQGKPSAASPALAAGEDPSAPVLEPGSRWLFAKLYCSPSHGDLLLTDLVRPLVEEVRGAGAAKGWFFLRYADPEWHLRLRFHGDPAALQGFVLPALSRRVQVLRRTGLLWHHAFDRYEPEVERYGGPHGIGLAERLFEADSDLALALLPLVLHEEGAHLRWKLAFHGADRLMGALGLDTGQRQALVTQLRGAREQSWITDGGYRQQVAHAFRAMEGRQTLEALLNPTQEAGPLPSEARAAFQRFEDRLRILRQQWQRLEESGGLSAPLPEIASSLVHMHLNRLLRACHLEQEAILCDFLGRAYAARLARQWRV